MVKSRPTGVSSYVDNTLVPMALSSSDRFGIDTDIKKSSVKSIVDDETRGR